MVSTDNRHGKHGCNKRGWGNKEIDEIGMRTNEGMEGEGRLCMGYQRITQPAQHPGAQSSCWSLAPPYTPGPVLFAPAMAGRPVCCS